MPNLKTLFQLRDRPAKLPSRTQSESRMQIKRKPSFDRGPGGGGGGGGRFNRGGGRGGDGYPRGPFANQKNQQQQFAFGQNAAHGPRIFVSRGGGRVPMRDGGSQRGYYSTHNNNVRPPFHQQQQQRPFHQQQRQQVPFSLIPPQSRSNSNWSGPPSINSGKSNS